MGSRFRGARPDTYPLFTGVLDSYPGAAAAYSLRALTRGWLAGDVVEVRRSTGGDPESFTASQITNGAMLDWVNTDPDPYNSDFSAGVDGITANLGTVDGNIDGIGGENDNLRFTVDTSSSTAHDASRDNEFTVGQQFQITGEFYIPSGQNSIDGIRVMDGAAGFQDRYESPSLDTWVSFDTGTVTPTNANLQFRPLDGGSNTVFDATGTDVFYIRNITVTQLTADGFVSTWYDQSGQANDATQAVTTSQPKIVDAGALVVGGLDFDGFNDNLVSTGLASTFRSTGNAFMFSAYSHRTAASGTECLIYGQAGGSSGTARIFLGSVSSNESGSGRRLDGDSFVQSTVAKSAGLKLRSVNFDWSGGYVQLFENGVGAAAAAFSSGSGLTSDTDNSPFTIGKLGAATNAFDGTASEIIIYDSDQSANRVAIETNINDHYGIY